MTATRTTLPEGRYGRSADERTDRVLKVTGAVLGAGLLALLGWFGYSYVSGQDVTGELIKFQVVSDDSVQAHLEVRKDAATPGLCTLRSLSESGAEVGWKDVRFEEREDRIDKVVTVRTTERATAVELLGCRPAPGA
ncbi:DUF4307 domain-containing protein [Streptomyces sp. WAC 00631]|uniref:DUF4307 domain-containing protein n=1 Tax=Streptomyces sp. WAC 00631 TaxID=2203201 RepID=UPI000F766E60|nr:DUF4307 domain-containing protein [Streptomyces sp. WAC 00631]MCC5035235.1 DUF4307 domain-containing protein [Streptomyces sp. WAC 00631]